MRDAPVSVRGWQKIDKRYGVDADNGGILEFPGGRMGVVSCLFETSGLGFHTVIGRQGLIDVPRGSVLGLLGIGRTLMFKALIVQQKAILPACRSPDSLGLFRLSTWQV